MRCASPKPLRWSELLMSNRFFGALIFVCLYSCVTVASDSTGYVGASMLIDGKAPTVIGRSACNNKTSKVKINFNDLTIWNKTKEFRAFAIEAKDKDKKCDKKPPPPNTTGLADFSQKKDIDLEILLIGSSDACLKNGDGAEGERLLCIYPEASGEEKPVAQIRFTYNTLVAKIRDISDDVAENGIVKFRVNITGGKVDQMDVCYGPKSSNKVDECPAETKPPIPGWRIIDYKTPDFSIDGLNQQETYRFKVRLKNTGKDEKWFELDKDLMPAAVAGPLDTYDGDGAPLMYSCNASPNAADILILAFIAALFIFFRKRSSFSGIKKHFLILPLIFLSQAQESRAEFGTVNVGILGSMYRPNLDGELGANDFYKCHFRGLPNKDGVLKEDGPINPLMGFEINWHLWDGLRVGFGLGYTYVSGFGLTLDKKNRPLCDQPRKSSSMSLHMYQFRPQLTYELDHFVDYFPLFPYVRGALIAQGYHINNGETGPKEKTNSEGKIIKNNGVNFGWSASLGLKLRLDFLDPGSVRSAQSAGFFDHVYLSSELSYEKIDNFGKGGFDFSPKDIMGTKLPLMWTFGISFDLL